METGVIPVKIGSTSEEFFCSAVDLAGLLKLSDNEITRLARSSILVRRVDPYDSRAYVYPVFENVTRYVTHVRERRERAQAVYLEERSKTQRALRFKTELQSGVASGRLGDKGEIIAGLVPVAEAFRNAAMARPEGLERKLSAIKGRQAKVDAIREDLMGLFTTFWSELINHPVLNWKGRNDPTPEKEGIEALR